MLGCKYFLLASFVSCCFCSFSQSYYYGVNNYGRLTLADNNKYFFDYFDTEQDTGSYRIIGDTLILKTNAVPVSFSKVNSDSLIQPNGFEIPMKVYQNGCLILDSVAIFDTLKTRVFIDTELQKGSLLSVQFIAFTYRIILDNDIIGKHWVKLDLDFKRRIYFEDYPLLISKGHLLPFSDFENDFFNKINGFYFLPMIEGRKNQPYSTYLSGFGEIH